MMSSRKGLEMRDYTVVESHMTGTIVDLAVLTSCRAVLEPLRAQQHFS